MKRLVLLLPLAVGLVVAAGAVHTSKPSWYARLLYPLEYEEIVRGHARNYGLDPALLAAVIYEESRFRADARSRSGAIGLMQLLPDTAKGIALHTGGSRFRVSDLYDPEINVRYGSWYLDHLREKYGDMSLALAAYHAGPASVDYWREQDLGIPFPATREYVDEVERHRQVYADAYGSELGLG